MQKVLIHFEPLWYWNLQRLITKRFQTSYEVQQKMDLFARFLWLSSSFNHEQITGRISQNSNAKVVTKQRERMSYR